MSNLSKLLFPYFYLHSRFVHHQIKCRPLVKIIYVFHYRFYELPLRTVEFLVIFLLASLSATVSMKFNTKRGEGVE